MTNQQMERRRLLHRIHMVSFAVNDITLYLDTHPKDQEALEYFNHYNKQRQKALQEYECKYGPLTLDTTTARGKWLWASQPMPWEGGSC